MAAMWVPLYIELSYMVCCSTHADIHQCTRLHTHMYKSYKYGQSILFVNNSTAHTCTRTRCLDNVSCRQLTNIQPGIRAGHLRESHTVLCPHSELVVEASLRQRNGVLSLLRQHILHFCPRHTGECLPQLWGGVWVEEHIDRGDGLSSSVDVGPAHYQSVINCSRNLTAYWSWYWGKNNYSPHTHKHTT